MINTDKFWSIIDKAAEFSKGDSEIKYDYLNAELAKLSLQEIKEFEVTFRKLLHDADDFGIMGAQKIIEGYVSDDSYLYFRCWLISQGKTIYTETLKDPDYLANIVDTDRDICEFEGLMYVATNAYAEITGQAEDESFPRGHADKLGLSYDFNVPSTKGIDWTEDQLPTRFPKLWTKLN